MICIEMPWPPSINNYYTRTSTGVMINKRGRTYRRDTLLILKKYKLAFTEFERLHMSVELYAPDKRKRDIDNHLKALQDALEHAEVFPNDEQIDRLTVERCCNIPEGLAKVFISVC